MRRGGSRRGSLLVVGALVVVVAAAVAIPLVVTGSHSSGPTNADLARLWQQTHTGQSQRDVLAAWPKNPYQHYADSTGADCYEWQDKPSGAYKGLPAHLYNLCFKGGVLRVKTVF